MRRADLKRGGGLLRRLPTSAVLLGAVIALTCAGPATGSSTEPASPLVAAASDLKFALDEVVAEFRRETGVAARVTYGSSGNLTRLIAQGAPFELFLSADEGYVFALADRGLTRDRGELYAMGRLTLFVPHGSPLTPDPQLAHLARRLADGSAGRLAIANPEHAPYGRAAEQALRKLGLWEAVSPRLLIGENVAQAAQFASSGNAEGGIIAHSLALAPPLRDRGRFLLLPDSLHEPLRQRMVLLDRATPAAARLYDYLRTPPARVILERHGFALPAE